MNDTTYGNTIAKSCKWLGMFWLFNIPLFLLLSLRYFAASSITLDMHLSLFLLLQYVGQFGVMSWLFCFALPLPLIFVAMPKLVRYFAIISCIFILLVLFVDTTVYRIYHYHINAVILHMIFSSAAGEIFTISWSDWLIIILILAAVIGYELWLKLKLDKSASGKGLVKITITTLIVFSCLFGSHIWHAWADATNDAEIIQSSDTVPIYFGLVARRWLLRHHLVTEKEILSNPAARMLKSSSKGLKYPLNALQFGQSKKHLNVLIIGIDDVRYDEVTNKAAPNISNFAQSATTFNRHYSGGNCTQPGLFTLFYGIPANYWANTYTNGIPPVLLTSLQSKGYKLGIFVSASLVQPPFYRNIFASVPNLIMQTPGNSPLIRDKNITAETNAFMTKSVHDKKPFLAFMFYDSVHDYAYPADKKLVFKPSDPGFSRSLLTANSDPTPIKNAHKNALHYVDGLIAQVLAKVKALKIMDNTVIIVTTDHGESFDDYHKNYWGHSSNFTAAQTHIPYIMYWPGKKPQQINYRTTHFDVVPTLLQNILGVKNPIADYSIGKSLWSQGGRDVMLMGSYSDMAVVTKKRILTYYPGGVYHLTDLQLNPATGIDPKALAKAMHWMSMYH